MSVLTLAWDSNVSDTYDITVYLHFISVRVSLQLVGSAVDGLLLRQEIRGTSKVLGVRSLDENFYNKSEEDRIGIKTRFYLAFTEYR